jgi:hypothetical protein
MDMGPSSLTGTGSVDGGGWSLPVVRTSSALTEDWDSAKLEAIIQSG